MSNKNRTIRRCCHTCIYEKHNDCFPGSYDHNRCGKCYAPFYKEWKPCSQAFKTKDGVRHIVELQHYDYVNSKVVGYEFSHNYYGWFEIDGTCHPYKE